jgi:UDPglucose 6-dehydrogenase
LRAGELFDQETFMKIAVLGTGYVGLVTGVCLAQLGHHVTCIDQDASKVAALRQGVCIIFEKGLEELLAKGLAAGNLLFSSALAGSVEDAEVIFICVGTPVSADGATPAMNYIDDACRQLAPLLNHTPVVVIKSTVPVGTSDRVRDIILKANPSAKFDVASNPEFLREGQAVADFMNPDRIILGVASKIAENKMRDVYTKHIGDDVPLLVTTPRSSELIKYASNSYLAMRLTFFNQISDLCETSGADFAEVAAGCGLDARIGGHYLTPGPGYGGSCFPKDTHALAAAARGLGSPVTLIEETIAANDARKAGLVTRIEKAIGGSVSGLTIAVLGLAFKAGTDDLRDSVALELIPELQGRGANVKAYDPASMIEAAKHFKGIGLATSATEALRDADVAVVLTEWQEFAEISPAILSSLMRGKTIVDFRNLFDAEAMSQNGLRYVPLGKPAREPATKELNRNVG